MKATPFEHEALWDKAKNFINRSFDCLENDDFPTAATWASLALELLGKSALAHRNPCLVADPSDDGLSLLIAAGLSEDISRAKSIPAKAVFSRCERAFRPFSASEAGRIAQSRNEELHSGLLPFETVADRESWWQRYWTQAAILIDAQDQTVEALVGGARQKQVRDHLARSAEHVSTWTLARIEEAKELVGPRGCCGP